MFAATRIPIVALSTVMLSSPPWLAFGAPSAREHATLVVETVELDTNRRIAARVRVGPGRNGSAQAIFASPIDAQDGLVRLRVPVGEHWIVATRGPEWSIHRSRVRVRAGGTSFHRAELRREVDPGTFVPCDFHLHTSASPDGRIDTRTRSATLALEGVEFGVITDHNVVTRPENRGEPHAHPAPTGGVVLGAGVELTTTDPDVGHFNIFPLPANTNEPGFRESLGARGRSPSEIFTGVHRVASDAIIQVNHPRLEDHIAYFTLHKIDPRRGASPNDPRLRFDALEVWNGFDIARLDQVASILDEWLALLAAGHRIVATGNSDSHDHLRQFPGYPRTYVDVSDVRGRQDGTSIARNLKLGRAFVTNGPILQVTVGGVRLGASTVAKAGHIRVMLRVLAPAWMDVDTVELRVGPKRVVRARCAPNRLMTFDVRVEGSTFLVVTARGAKPMRDLLPRGDVFPFAFTNPIWVDAT